jgi:asparagine synthase (glutamine-hydrolysing)
MGQLAGIFYFDQRPTGEADLADLLGMLAPGSSVSRSTTGPGLAMVQVGGYETGGAALADRESHDSICHFDGRLDNRSELRAEDINRRGDADRSPASLIPDLYKKDSWGAFKKLVGDWSLAIWDKREDWILLASDYTGVLPLYFSIARDGLRWCSSLTALAKESEARNLNDDYVTEFLVHGRARGGTPFRDIQAVPAGHVVRVAKNGKFQIECFWAPPLERTVRFRSQAEYEERLRDLFSESVRVRLDSAESVSAELSGGLDSSSIVCIAQQLISSGAVRAKALTPLTYLGQESTDHRYATSVADSCGLAAARIDLGQHGFAASYAVGEGLPGWWGPRNEEVLRLMKQSGSATLLTGQGGDLVMGNWFEGSEHVGACFAAGRVGGALRSAVAWGRAARQPFYSVLKDGLGITAGWLCRDAGFGCRSRGDLLPAETSLTKQAEKRAIEMARRHLTRARWRAVPPGCRRRTQALLEVLESRYLLSPESLEPFRWSHPFTHRPLVEFMLTIPPEIVYSATEPRRLMRRALAGFVPAQVLNRRSKTGYNDVFRQSLVPMAKTLLAAPTGLLLAERGFVEEGSVRNRLRCFARGMASNETQLRHIILMEFWLRNRAGIKTKELRLRS